jgi:hypothetical protein
MAMSDEFERMSKEAVVANFVYFTSKRLDGLRETPKSLSVHGRFPEMRPLEYEASVANYRS